MAVGDIYRLSTKANLYGTRCVNVFHFRLESPPSGDDVEDDLFSGFVADILPALVVPLSNQLTFHCATVQNVEDLAGNPHEYFFTAGNVGVVEEASLPPNKCAVVALYSAEYNRNGRGRKYFAGIPVTHEVDNALTDDARSDWESIATALKTNVTGGSGGGTWQNAIWSPTNATGYVVVRAAAGPQVHSLRGRTVARC